MAARTLHEAMQAVVDKEDCTRMLNIMKKLAIDQGIPHLKDTDLFGTFLYIHLFLLFNIKM